MYGAYLRVVHVRHILRAPQPFRHGRRARESLRQEIGRVKVGAPHRALAAQESVVELARRQRGVRVRVYRVPGQPGGA